MSDDLEILREARQRVVSLIEDLAAQREGLKRFPSHDYAPADAALARAIDSAAKLLQAIDQAIEKAHHSSD